MNTLKYIIGIVAALAMTSCGNHLPKDGKPAANGMEFLAVAGIDGDSLNIDSDFTFGNDAEDLAHMMLTLDTIKALGLDKVMAIDTVVGSVRIMGRHQFEGTSLALLLGETTLGDTRTCWLATYGRDGMIDFMRIGNCHGINLNYWDEADEHTCHVGIDSTAITFGKDNDKSIQLQRRVSMKVRQDGAEPSDSALWFIQNNVPVTIGNDGRFTLGKTTNDYSGSSDLLTAYWLKKRGMEVLAWIPLSDNTFCDQVSAFLDASKDSLTDPAQLWGDFSQLIWSRLAGDTDGVMTWCCAHPDTQLAHATVKALKDCTPEYLDTLLQRVTDAKARDYCRQQLGK